MPVAVERDLDFLAARLHGRRSLLAEGARLDDLCRIRTVDELARRIVPGCAVRQAIPFQRHMIDAYLRELGMLAAGVGGAGGDFLGWQRTRFQVENLKVLARGMARRLPPESVKPHLIELPDDLALDLAPYADGPDGAPLLARLQSLLPSGAHLRTALEQSGDAFIDTTEPFLAEAALDRAYLRWLLRHAGAVGGEDGAGVRRLAEHEAGIFNTMLVIRGRQSYSLPPDLLRAACVPDGVPGRETIEQVIGAGDEADGLRMLAAQLDSAGAAGFPPEPAAIEALAWNRYLKLANALFRQSQMSVGVVIGFAAIRRIELANLITLCEGMRLGIDPRRLRQRLVPRTGMEAAHV